jgi:hypothetical protein
MDFVEHLFGLSPDSGNGSFEVSIALCILAAISVLMFRRKLAAALNGRRSPKI